MPDIDHHLRKVACAKFSDFCYKINEHLAYIFDSKRAWLLE